MKIKVSVDFRSILLDGNDITALVTEENNVHSYVPVTPLSSGEHSLFILARTENGTMLEREFRFFSRHSESYEEIYSDNRVSATLKTALNRSFSKGDDLPGDSTDRLNSDFAGNSTSTIYTGADFPYTSIDRRTWCLFPDWRVFSRRNLQA